jgi:nucleotide-binding universal stress UspA family protein
VAADHVGMTDSRQTDRLPTVVWATDGSVASLAGSRFVREFGERHARTLRIVHVAPAVCTQADERRIAKVKALTRSLRRHGIDASLHVVRGALGSPAPHIAEVARRSRAGLLIVGTRGRSPVISAVAGSVAQRLLAEAPCPVLVLPAAHAATGARRSARLRAEVTQVCEGALVDQPSGARGADAVAQGFDLAEDV